MKLIVCPRNNFEEVFATERPSHVLRFISPGDVEPGGAPGTEQLVIACNDISAAYQDLVPPSAAQVASIIDFARRMTPDSRLVIQCLAGVSRSTAAAAIVLAARHPDLDERRIFETLRVRSAFATPNALMIALADTALERDGRFVGAALAIGRGQDYAAYHSFAMPDFDDAA